MKWCCSPVEECRCLVSCHDLIHPKAGERLPYGTWDFWHAPSRTIRYSSPQQTLDYGKGSRSFCGSSRQRRKELKIAIALSSVSTV